ncbi:hybrid sensor histidine kinase/response regulator [Sphingomonas ginkgonis]|uniref:hybrid sensor histidine kinase/response regulator n=1 Tax=Sphingomonas ginkgonis TaxID=2315330 RepID=UPI00163993D9|nr:PAS domain S-box protein [Sphingomonas ginkgonis]
MASSMRASATFLPLIDRLASCLLVPMPDDHALSPFWRNSQDLLGIADTNGVWLSVNPAWSRTLGWEVSDIVGRTSEWMEHPDDRDATRREVAELAAGSPTYHFENRFRTKNGDYRTLSWTSATEDGRLYCVARDVTELRARTLALADLVAKRSRTWDLTPDLLSVIDLTSGCFDNVNLAWTAVLGWTIDEVEGKPFADFLHPDDLAGSAQAFEKARRGEPVIRFENRYRTKDGGWKWLSWVALPDGDKLYSSTRDVTEENDRATALVDAQEGMRQAQKMEAVGQLTGGVAHDFNNLLTVIRGSVDLLRRPNLPEEKRHRYIDAIGETADRAAKLTSQLLAFARRQTLKPETFNLVDSIDHVANIVQTLAGSRIELEVIRPAIPLLVTADKSQFDTAIVNMAVNARDAMKGEGRLTIRVGAVSNIPARRTHTSVVGDFVAVVVTDTGTGIAEADLMRVFEPFFTTKGVGQGTGLGLSQVFGFAKQSGGDVHVESTVGEGTTFTLYLPREFEQTEKPASVPLSSVGGRGLCVLVVEDNESVGDFASEALVELGYDSILARTGQEALERLAEDCGRFRVVFSDVVMPGMSGIELAEAVRRDYPQLPVILTSGYSHVLAENGQHGYELLHKPYSIEQLSHLLRKAIAWQNNEREVPA